MSGGGPMISIIVVTYNAARTIRACLESLFTHAPSTAEIIVVDTGSTDATLDILRSYTAQGVRLIRGGNPLCFGGAGNLGTGFASHDILYFHNADACLTGNIFNDMTACLRAHPRLAAIGPRMTRPDGQALQTAHAFASPRKWLLQVLHLDRMFRISRVARICAAVPVAANYAHRVGSLPAARPLQDVDWLSRAGLMLRRQAFEEAGGFDAGIVLKSEDEDLCRRLRNAGHAVAFHHTDAAVMLDGSPDQGRRGVARLKRAARQMFIDKHFTGHRRWLMHGLLYAKLWLRPD